MSGFHHTVHVRSECVVERMEERSVLVDTLFIISGNVYHFQERVTRVVTKINGHRDKRSSNLSYLNSVKNKIPKTK